MWTPLPAGMTKRYRGRFAPSPTGPLHFGSLIAAVASYLQARQNGGQWLVRIEDIDPPREVPGASDSILRTLEAHGFEWDEAVSYQSQRSEFYEDALDKLQQMDLLFACACSRKEITKQTPDGIYPGTCRQGVPAGRHARSWRVRSDARDIRFNDAIQGDIHCALSTEVGDFVLKRADGLYAYQLAVAIDDAAQGMTEVVRGVDLLSCTSQQIYLHQLLGYTSPQYIHHPVATNAQGQKLSKQNQAPALDGANPVTHLWHALTFLGQSPPTELQKSALPAIWAWAFEHWQLSNIPHTTGRQVEENGQLSDR